MIGDYFNYTIILLLMPFSFLSFINLQSYASSMLFILLFSVHHMLNLGNTNYVTCNYYCFHIYSAWSYFYYPSLRILYFPLSYLSELRVSSIFSRIRSLFSSISVGLHPAFMSHPKHRRSTCDDYPFLTGRMHRERDNYNPIFSGSPLISNYPYII